MFERFTDRARRVVVLAQEEARLLNHDYIGTEHLLLGLLHESEGLAAHVLQRLGIDLEAARSRVEALIGAGIRTPTGHLPFTTRAKKVLELSLRESFQLGHSHIGTEHILLGLLREAEGVGARVVTDLGVELSQVRQEVIKVLSGAVSSMWPEAEGPPAGLPSLTVRAVDGGLAVFLEDDDLRRRFLGVVEREPPEMRSDDPAAASFAHVWENLASSLTEVVWRLEREADARWRPPEWQLDWNVAAYAVIASPFRRYTDLQMAEGVDTEAERAGLAQWLTEHPGDADELATYVVLLADADEQGEVTYQMFTGTHPQWPAVPIPTLVAHGIRHLADG